MSENKIRTNFFLSKELKQYVDTEADRLSMSNSAFIIMCINQYRQQNEVKDVMINFDELLKKVEALTKSKSL